MAITTLDGVFAGLKPPLMGSKTMVSDSRAGVWKSTWAMAGTGGTGGTTVGAQSLSTTAGSIPRSNPGSGTAYLTEAGFCFPGAGSHGQVMLLDRIWQSGSVAVTTGGGGSSAITTTLPGTERGEDYYVMFVEIISGGALNSVFTVTYNSGVTSTVTVSGTSTAGDTFAVPLGAGETAVTDITNFAYSVGIGGGAVQVVIARVVALIVSDKPVNSTNIIYTRGDIMRGCGGRIYDDSVLYFMFNSASAGTAGTCKYFIRETHG
jgi:hypothetical protein